MKKILTLMLLTTVVLVTSSTMNLQEAHAQLLPSSCTDWADGGYNKVVLGWLCAAEVAMQEAYPWQDQYSSIIRIKNPDDMKYETLYTLKTSLAKIRRNWQALRA